MDYSSECFNKNSNIFFNEIGEIKVKFLWEGHKNVCNRPFGFEIYLVNVKTLRTIAQIFAAFSEKLNFNQKNLRVHQILALQLHEHNVKETVG